MSKRNNDIRKFIEMQLFFQSHSKQDIGPTFENSDFETKNFQSMLENEDSNEIEYMMLIEDILASEDSEAHSIFGKYKH